MAGRPKKAVATPTEENVVEDKNKDLSKENEELKNLIESMQAQMKEMQDKISTAQPIVVNTVSENNGRRKVRVMSLMYNPVNVSTEPYGTGKVFEFSNFGEVRPISFDDLYDIVASYPNTMKNGMLYICDKDIVKELGMEDEYENIYDKDMIDRIKYLRTDADADLFIGMSKSMRESVARESAELMNKNEKMDLNILRKIKDNTGIDIEDIAKNIKENFEQKQE